MIECDDDYSRIKEVMEWEKRGRVVGEVGGRYAASVDEKKEKTNIKVVRCKPT